MSKDKEGLDNNEGFYGTGSSVPLGINLPLPHSEETKLKSM